MEGRRSAGDAAEGRQYCSGRDGCGHESEGSTVELSLRLTTGSPAAAAAAEAEAEAEAEGERKSMTMFYKGQVCVVDVTELQARTIISMANRQLAQCDHQYHQTQEAAAAEEEAPPQPALLGTGLSMKRSLQRFLQKRKARAAAVAAPPYAGRPDHGSLKSSPTS